MARWEVMYKSEPVNLIDSDVKKLQKELQEAIQGYVCSYAQQFNMKPVEALEIIFPDEIKDLKGDGKIKIPPKYYNPKQPKETWAGRGRKPKWVLSHLKKGGELADLSIEH